VSNRLLVLWATPRTVSTAFERMMIERGDHHVVDEPFSVPYYVGPSQRSDRFAVEPGVADPEHVVAELLAAAERAPVFVKDMAYHAEPWVDADFLGLATNTFLVRDPAWALPSLARKWPDFTDDEAGYAAQGRLFDHASVLGDVVVIDSDDLRADPAGMIAAWCARIGVPFLPESLTWDPGMQDEWIRWRDWYEATADSTGFAPPSDDPPPPVTDARVREALAAARPIYEHLHARRLRP
jgi:hypothetical protein